MFYIFFVLHDSPAVISQNCGFTNRAFKFIFLFYKLTTITLQVYIFIGCGHCKRMKPDYVSAANELEAEGLKKCLAMVDCTENPDLMEKYNIEGFPTIKLFRNGDYVVDYKGKRTVEDIKQFVKKYYTSRDEL